MLLRAKLLVNGDRLVVRQGSGGRCSVIRYSGYGRSTRGRVLLPPQSAEKADQRFREIVSREGYGRTDMDPMAA